MGLHSLTGHCGLQKSIRHEIKKCPDKLELAYKIYIRSTCLLSEFCKLWFMDEFLKLAPRCSGLLAPGAGQLPGVYRKERYFKPI